MSVEDTGDNELPRTKDGDIVLNEGVLDRWGQSSEKVIRLNSGNEPRLPGSETKRIYYQPSGRETVDHEAIKQKVIELVKLKMREKGGSGSTSSQHSPYFYESDPDLKDILERFSPRERMNIEEKARQILWTEEAPKRAAEEKANEERVLKLYEERKAACGKD